MLLLTTLIAIAAGLPIAYAGGVPFFLLNGNFSVLKYAVKPCVAVSAGPLAYVDYAGEHIAIGYKVRYNCEAVGASIEKVVRIGNDTYIFVQYNVSDEYYIPLTLYASRINIIILKEIDGIHIRFVLGNITAAPIASELRRLVGVNISDSMLPRSITLEYLVDPEDGDTWLLSPGSRVYLGKNPFCIPESLDSEKFAAMLVENYYRLLESMARNKALLEPLIAKVRSAGEPLRSIILLNTTRMLMNLYVYRCGSYMGFGLYMDPYDSTIIVTLPEKLEWRAVNNVYKPNYTAVRLYFNSSSASLLKQVAEGDEVAVRQLLSVVPKLFYKVLSYEPGLYIESPAGRGVGYIAFPLNKSLELVLTVPLALDNATSQRLFGARYIILNVPLPETRRAIGANVSLTFAPRDYFNRFFAGWNGRGVRAVADAIQDSLKGVLVNVSKTGELTREIIFKAVRKVLETYVAQGFSVGLLLNSIPGELLKGLAEPKKAGAILGNTQHAGETRAVSGSSSALQYGAASKGEGSEGAAPHRGNWHLAAILVAAIAAAIALYLSSRVKPSGKR